MVAKACQAALLRLVDVVDDVENDGRREHPRRRRQNCRSQQESEAVSALCSSLEEVTAMISTTDINQRL